MSATLHALAHRRSPVVPILPRRLVVRRRYLRSLTRYLPDLRSMRCFLAVTQPHARLSDSRYALSMLFLSNRWYIRNIQGRPIDSMNGNSGMIQKRAGR